MPTRRHGDARLAAVRPLLRLLVRAPTGPPAPVRAQRAWYRLTAPTNRPRHRLPRSRANAGGVPVERVDGAGGEAEPAVLYLHGGAYCLHSPRVYRPLTASLAHAAGAAVFAADYRRAPEHPFPAALDDALTCYRWLCDLGIAPGRIAIAGDSAGGGLAVAVTALLARDGLPRPAALVLFSPWLDLTLSGESIRTKARADVIMRRSWLEASARMYRAATGADDYRCSPLFGELSELPPTLIQSGTEDIILSDSERLAERAAEAGFDVELDLRSGLFHSFQNFPGMLPQAEAALADVGVFLRRRWSAAGGLG